MKWSWLFIFMFYNPLIAFNAVEISHESEKIFLGEYLDILEDRSGILTPDDVIYSGKYQSLFKRSMVATPNFGFSEATYWVRFSIKNMTGMQIKKYLEDNFSPTDEIDLYIPDRKGRYFIKKHGDLLPFNQREIDLHTPVFPLPVETGTNIYYLKIKSTSAVIIDLRLYSARGLIKQVTTRQILYGIFYGIMMIMIVYNIFIYYIIRDNIYVLYVIFILSSASFQFSLNGLAFQYIWPESIWLANNSVPILLGFNLAAAGLFSKSFLHIKKYSRFLNYLFYVIVALSVLGISLSFSSYRLGIRIGSAIAPVLLITIYISGYISYRNGESSAKYFLMAWFLFLIGGTLKALHVNKLVPDNLLTTSGYQVGAAAEVILLSLALADRLRSTRKQAEMLRAEVLKNQLKEKRTLEEEVKKKKNELNIQKMQLELKKREYDHGLGIARSMQNKLIPKDIPMNIAAIYRPMIEVGGDFYDFVSFNNGRTGIFICDVVGHGVQAALTTSVIKMLILQAEHRKESPAELLQYMDDILCNKFDFGFITMYYAIYNPENRELISANAGHPQPVVLSQADCRILESQKTYPAGLKLKSKSSRDLNRFNNSRHILSMGSKIFFFTDGLTECISLDKKEYFEDSEFFTVLTRNKDNSCYELVKNVMDAAEKFAGSSNFEDDICMICLDVI